MSAAAMQTVQVQLDLAKRFRRPDLAAGAERVFQAEFAKDPEVAAVAATLASVVAATIREQLEGAETFHVEPGLVARLLDSEAGQIDLVAEASWVPDRGFVRLGGDRPLLVNAAGGELVAIRALFWTKNEAGLAVAAFSSLDDIDADTSLQAMEKTEPGSVEHLRSLYGDITPTTAYVLVGGVASALPPIVEFLVRLWRHMRQRDVLYVEAADKAVRRRLRVERLTPEAGEVHVVVTGRERRRYLADPTHSSPPHAVKWSHRWKVRSHWRQQWYPSLGEHRPKLIGEYVKGPEGAPLDVRRRVDRLK